MNSYLVIFFFVIAGCAAQDDGGFLKSHLPGKWKEDQHKRKNLNNYLINFQYKNYFNYKEVLYLKKKN